MVAYAKQQETRTSDSAWWAHSRELGWVVLDRTCPQNRTTTLPEQMCFTRCADWQEFRQGDRTWDYQEAEHYLDSLPYDEADEAEAEWVELQKTFLAKN